MNEFENGTLVICRAVFTNPTTGAFVDPSTVTVTITTPAAVATTYTYTVDTQLVQDSSGHYHVNVDAQALGTWIYRFACSGTFEGASQGTFYIY